MAKFIEVTQISGGIFNAEVSDKVFINIDMIYKVYRSCHEEPKLIYNTYIENYGPEIHNTIKVVETYDEVVELIKTQTQK